MGGKSYEATGFRVKMTTDNGILRGDLNLTSE